MIELSFALIREGTSDDGLVAHIRTLLLRSGVRAAVGASRQYPGSLRSRLSEVWNEPRKVDLVFVHRDADARDPSARHQEIHDAAAAVGIPHQIVVPVVPVQELESWLLVDPDAIRMAVGRPKGRSKLDLPPAARLESTSFAKEKLASACLSASETSGARRTREIKRFPERRAALLDRLDIDGPVTALPSWQRFVADLESAAAHLLASR